MPTLWNSQQLLQTNFIPLLKKVLGLIQLLLNENLSSPNFFFLSLDRDLIDGLKHTLEKEYKEKLRW